MLVTCTVETIMRLISLARGEPMTENTADYLRRMGARAKPIVA